MVLTTHHNCHKKQHRNDPHDHPHSSLPPLMTTMRNQTLEKQSKYTNFESLENDCISMDDHHHDEEWSEPTTTTKQTRSDQSPLILDSPNGSLDCSLDLSSPLPPSFHLVGELLLQQQLNLNNNNNQTNNHSNNQTRFKNILIEHELVNDAQGDVMAGDDSYMYRSPSSLCESQTFSIETESLEEELVSDSDQEESSMNGNEMEESDEFIENSDQRQNEEERGRRGVGMERRRVERIFRDDPCGSVVEESEEMLRSGFSKFGNLLRKLKELLKDAKEQLIHEWDENGRYLLNYYYHQVAHYSGGDESHLSKLLHAVTPRKLQQLFDGLTLVMNRLLILKSTSHSNTSSESLYLSPHNFSRSNSKSDNCQQTNSSPQRHHIKELPREILENIFSYLFQKGGVSNKNGFTTATTATTNTSFLCEEDFLSAFARANIFSVLLTCREWYEVVTESTQFWRERVIRLSFHLKRKEFHDITNSTHKNGKVFRNSSQLQQPTESNSAFVHNPSSLSNFTSNISVDSQKKALLDETLLDIDLKMKRFHTDHPKRCKQFYFFYWLSLLRQVQEQQARKHENSILQVSSAFQHHGSDTSHQTWTSLRSRQNAIASKMRFQSGVEIVFVLIVGLFFIWQWFGLLLFGGIFSKSNSRNGKTLGSHKRRLIH
ncbi:hypothetical protein C9374_014686 [Naegleria lovaniensis]|uniref:F-box domain-containing protein n=1 Tax=Naegleria lovaniensis TaxID=51637 RepID=A0AA88GCY8_NAELO|nr:uncharacterized protein C9374_014686 [Naegleria lovaniensis]KAG2370670.1 hypothetical protein C9374_014686 [Naegleria lovaniensis]